MTNQHIEIEIFSENINAPVLKLPFRKFPGILIQGDTLKNLSVIAEEIADLCCKKNKNEELKELSIFLSDQLQNFVNIYEKTLKSSGLALPYTKTRRVAE